jgi:hypothetical protein
LGNREKEKREKEKSKIQHGLTGSTYRPTNSSSAQAQPGIPPCSPSSFSTQFCSSRHLVGLPGQLVVSPLMRTPRPCPSPTCGTHITSVILLAHNKLAATAAAGAWMAYQPPGSSRVWAAPGSCGHYSTRSRLGIRRGGETPHFHLPSFFLVA